MIGGQTASLPGARAMGKAAARCPSNQSRGGGCITTEPLTRINPHLAAAPGHSDSCRRRAVYRQGDTDTFNARAWDRTNTKTAHTLFRVCPSLPSRKSSHEEQKKGKHTHTRTFARGCSLPRSALATRRSTSCAGGRRPRPPPGDKLSPSPPFCLDRASVRPLDWT